MSHQPRPRVGPDDVGRRVVLRRRVPGGRVADVLGDLLAWDPAGDAVVRTRQGAVAVPVRDLVAGKPVPPPPTRRGSPHRAIGLEGLEDVASDGWRPLEQEELAGPGTWRLRAAGGFTGRANSALVLGGSGALDLPAAVEAVERWYAARGLPARFALPWPLDAPAGPDGARESPLDMVLAGRGYALDTPTLVLTAALREVAGAASVPASAPSTGAVPRPAVTLADEPDAAWLEVYRYRGAPLPDVAPRVLLSAPSQVFLSVRDGARTVAVARAASSRGWTGVTAMEVEQTHRRRGLALLLLGAVAEWGLGRGDRSGYLQVAEHNGPARRLYERAGFTAHHGYQYRVAPA